MTDDAAAQDILQRLLDKAKAGGANAADALLAESLSLSHAQRLGNVERLEREESRDIGLRVFFGRKQAIASSTDLTANALDELVDRVIAMARAVPEDLYCGLAAPDQITRDFPDIDIDDPVEPAPETLIEKARACEEAALAVEGVTNSEGAECGWGRTRLTLAATNGFIGSYARSNHSLAAAVLAGEAPGMERDFEFTSAVYAEDLLDPAEVGRRAGEKTVARLGARKPKTGRIPVVYDPRVANSLLGHFASAIMGPAIARKTSFLKDMLGEEVFSPDIAIVDDPRQRRGLRSKPFDGEGLAAEPLSLIENGRLTTWVLDLSSARQLGLASTGRAARGTSAPPSPSVTNLYMEPGQVTPEELIADIEEGFYVTELMGMGVNPVTGDYSRGAAGFRIEKGEITFPVSEVTVAGQLKEMFKTIVPANDLVFKYGANAPTLRVEGMTVAGQ